MNEYNEFNKKNKHPHKNPCSGIDSWNFVTVYISSTDYRYP